MISSRPPLRLPGLTRTLWTLGLAVLILLTPVSLPTAQAPAPARNEPPPPPPARNDAATPAAPGPKGVAQKSDRDKLKADASELSALANKLHDELNKMNVNVFSLEAVQKTEEIERLAKKIKGEAGGR